MTCHRHRTLTLLPGLALIVLPLAAAAEPAGSLTEAELLDRLRQKAAPTYAKYRGVWQKRRVTVKERDPDSGKVEKTKTMTVQVHQYFYRPPQTKILTCAINGQKKAAEECQGKGEPKNILPVFDEDGAKNYSVSLSGEAKVGGRPCYKLRVIPKKRTERHFWGDFYVAKDTLEPVRMTGTMGDLPFPLKRFRLDLRFAKQGGRSVSTRGTVDITVKVPIVFHARIVSRYQALETRMIPK